MTEPDLVTLGNRVALDDFSVVAHINSRGKFALNHLAVADGYVSHPIHRLSFHTYFAFRCALRTGSHLLSGAQMEEYSMLLEHALLASGDIAESGAIYAGWPARQHELSHGSQSTVFATSVDMEKGDSASKFSERMDSTTEPSERSDSKHSM